MNFKTLKEKERNSEEENLLKVMEELYLNKKLLTKYKNGANIAKFYVMKNIYETKITKIIK